MEYTLKNIISIDKKASDYRDNLDGVLRNEKKVFSLEIENMNKEFKSSLEKECSDIIGSYINESNKEAIFIREKGIIDIKNIKEKYEESKEDMAEKIFSLICKSI